METPCAPPDDPASKPDDGCYRCGYALRGIADDQACPECGLVALRSRRPSDELHDTRPRWLRRLALGAGLILLAILSVPAWPFALAWLNDWGRVRFWTWPGWYRAIADTAWLIALELSALLLLGGVFLLTSREGYEPADRADRLLRQWLRLAATAPLAALLLLHADAGLDLLLRSSRYRSSHWSTAELMAITLVTIGCVPLPLLLFRQLRGLAVRARSAHLAEHCTIVGIGTSATLAFVPLVMIVFANAEELGLGENWVSKSNAALVLALTLSVAGTLFPLWSLYLLGSFTVAFRSAARRLRKQWISNDRALAIRS